MNVACPKCGKSLKVKDEWAGRMLKCPACSTAFPAKAVGSAAPGRASGPPARKQAEAKAGVAINWGVIVLWGGVALFVLGILAVVFGPVKVKRQLDANQGKYEDDVRDVIDYALQCQASNDGSWNPNKSGNSPTVVELRLLPDIFRMSMPKTIPFDGSTSNGRYEGTYDTETGEVDMTLKIGGITLPSGIHIDEEGTILPGGQRVEGKAPIPGAKGAKSKMESVHVTGRVTPQGPKAELDGKKAEIYYPPKVDDDGNVIDPPKKK